MRKESHLQTNSSLAVRLFLVALPLFKMNVMNSCTWRWPLLD